jgi:hypothetical protein
MVIFRMDCSNPLMLKYTIRYSLSLCECVVVLITTYLVYHGTFIGFYFVFDILVEGLQPAGCTKSHRINFIRVVAGKYVQHISSSRDKKDSSLDYDKITDI